MVRPFPLGSCAWNDLLRDFLTESAENLARLDREIVALERAPGDLMLLSSIFRTIHTIKGTCGFLDLQRLERVAHAAENVLDQMRDGSLAVTPDIISDVLAAVDVIKEMLEGLELTESEPQGDDTALIARLARWTGGAGEAEPNLSFEEIAAQLAARRAESVVEAAETEENTAEEMVTEAAPRPRAARKRKSLRRERRRPLARRAAPPLRPAAAPAPAPEAAAPESAARGSVAESSLRVPVEVLDRLMNLAGELVLTRNQLVQVGDEDESFALRLPLQNLSRVTSELQEAVMRTRMQPVGNAWGKLPRLVRDLCQASGKQIDLELHGAETELDRQVLQAIGDPLTHMVRNSADHGVEAPEVRRAAGKPERGTIRLNAFHEGGHIVIEVGDDGRGLDAAVIRQKAIERGLVRAEQAASLSDAQVFRFIFEAGFSTAAQVTNVSGRGVGMDVVRSNLEKIGGSVELASTLGEGTTVRVKIPLTLAILSALIVGSGGQSFAVPQIGVTELVRVDESNAALLEIINGAQFYRLRDTLLPLVPLSAVLPDGERRRSRREHRGLSGGRAPLRAPGGRDLRYARDRGEAGRPHGQAPPGLCGHHHPGRWPGGDDSRRARHCRDHAGDGAGGRRCGGRRGGGVPRRRGVSRCSSSTAAIRCAGRCRSRASRDSRSSRPPTSRWPTGAGWCSTAALCFPSFPPAPGWTRARLDPRPTIVFTDGSRSLGLAVDEIHDIVEDHLTIEMDAAADGLLGTAVIGGRSAEVLDIDYFFDDARGARMHSSALPASARVPRPVRSRHAARGVGGDPHFRTGRRDDLPRGPRPPRPERRHARPSRPPRCAPTCRASSPSASLASTSACPCGSCRRCSPPRRSRPCRWRRPRWPASSICAARSSPRSISARASGSRPAAPPPRA